MHARVTVGHAHVTVVHAHVTVGHAHITIVHVYVTVHVVVGARLSGCSNGNRTTCM